MSPAAARPAARRPAQRAGLAVLAVLTGLAALPGCGVPAESQPRAIEASALRPLPAAPPADRSAAGPATQTLCLTRDEQLVEVTRPVSRPVTVETTVSDLLAGPTAAESASGVGTALGGAPLVTGVRLEGPLAVVSLRSGQETSRADDVLALGQVVCTLTARPDVQGVVFERGGDRVEVPRGDGSLARGPLGRADFASLRASDD